MGFMLKLRFNRRKYEGECKNVLPGHILTTITNLKFKATSSRQITSCYMRWKEETQGYNLDP